MEAGHATVAGIEVKVTATATERELRGLRKFRSVAGRRFAPGVVLYDGSATIAFGEGLFAVPLGTLWEST